MSDLHQATSTFNYSLERLILVIGEGFNSSADVEARAILGVAQQRLEDAREATILRVLQQGPIDLEALPRRAGMTPDEAVDTVVVLLVKTKVDVVRFEGTMLVRLNIPQENTDARH